MKSKLFLFLFGILFMINFISAAGLQIIGTSSFAINKTISETSIINFQVQNTDNRSFSNISFENNPYLSFNTISILNPSEIANINASIIGTQSFNGNIKIRGFYFQDIGQPLETHNIDVFFSSGISECDLVTIEGDNIEWKNNHLNSINMINKDTGQIITTIQANSTYIQSFPAPQILNYYFSTSGFQFTNNCRVSALSSQGWVNNPSLDALIYLNLVINFPPTTIELIIPATNYTIDA